MTAPLRILVTDAAVAVMRELTAAHGALMFHQSGGCCDGSAPMCYPAGEFRTGGQDVLLGTVGDDIPVWIGAAQFAYWRHTQVTIDVVDGRGAGFSLEGPTGKRFIIRSRVFTDDEVDALDAQGEPRRGG
ncbi:DUF779 domain-containing protein [Sphingomonas sp. 37zxx]|uniref:DUF779 domain-containing protein n=1 Tax=Sphingomonas sp. 37zxx TaxID=1550073 RepID=UPI00053BEB01|nr:DUF779 domain-containing protein [Sphingomonas sp. 37zxx]